MMSGEGMLRVRIMVWSVNREKKQIQTLTCCYNTLYQNPAEHAARNSFSPLSSSLVPFLFFFSSFSISTRKHATKSHAWYRSHAARVSAPEREVRCRRPRGTLMATCAILTAAIRFDNYSDANGRDRCVFSWDPTSGWERSGGGRRDGEERRGVLLPRIPFRKCQSALSHAQLIID